MQCAPYKNFPVIRLKLEFDNISWLRSYIFMFNVSMCTFVHVYMRPCIIHVSPCLHVSSIHISICLCGHMLIFPYFHVFMCPCAYVSMYLFVSMCSYFYVSIYTCVHASMSPCEHVCTCLSMCVHMCVCVSMCIHVSVCPCAYESYSTGGTRWFKVLPYGTTNTITLAWVWETNIPNC